MRRLIVAHNCDLLTKTKSHFSCIAAKHKFLGDRVDCTEIKPLFEACTTCFVILTRALMASGSNGCNGALVCYCLSFTLRRLPSIQISDFWSQRTLKMCANCVHSVKQLNPRMLFVCEIDFRLHFCSFYLQLLYRKLHVHTEKSNNRKTAKHLVFHPLLVVKKN